MNLRNSLGAGIVFFLLSPFLILLFHFRTTFQFDWSEFAWALKNSVYQSTLSALVSTVLGLWCALGLIAFSESSRRHWRTLLELMCLLPNFVPPLFILLAALNFADPFPMGIMGIVLIHVLINFGLVAVILAGLIETKLGSLVELCLIEGVGRFRFLKSVFFPVLLKDIFLLFLFVFSVCFTSFSIPLIVGGSHGTTLEVLIYEKIRLSTDWGQAISLAFLQSGFLFVLSLFALKGQGSLQERPANFSLIQSRTGALLIVIIFASILVGYGQGVFDGLQQISRFFEFQSALIWGAAGTLILGISAGVLTYVFLFLILAAWPLPWFEKFLSGYMAPSTSLTCFALLILTPNEGFWPFIKIPTAMVMVCLTSLYRMGWRAEIERMRRQIEVATCLGAKPISLLKFVLLPQLSRRAGFFAALVAVWTCGDFAISRILAHQDLSIAMMTQTLMSSYRLGMATILSLLIVVLCLVCFFVLIGVSHVIGRKFTS